MTERTYKIKHEAPKCELTDEFHFTVNEANGLSLTTLEFGPTYYLGTVYQVGVDGNWYYQEQTKRQHRVKQRANAECLRLIKECRKFWKENGTTKRSIRLAEIAERKAKRRAERLAAKG